RSPSLGRRLGRKPGRPPGQCRRPRPSSGPPVPGTLLDSLRVSYESLPARLGHTAERPGPASQRYARGVVQRGRWPEPPGVAKAGPQRLLPAGLLSACGLTTARGGSPRKTTTTLRATSRRSCTTDSVEALEECGVTSILGSLSSGS